MHLANKSGGNGPNTIQVAYLHTLCYALMSELQCLVTHTQDRDPQNCHTDPIPMTNKHLELSGQGLNHVRITGRPVAWHLCGCWECKLWSLH